jgi:hypothetical protein
MIAEIKKRARSKRDHNALENALADLHKIEARRRDSYARVRVRGEFLNCQLQANKV